MSGYETLIIDDGFLYECGHGRKSGGIFTVSGKRVVLFDPSEGEYENGMDSDSKYVALFRASPALYMALQMIECASREGPIRNIARDALAEVDA